MSDVFHIAGQPNDGGVFTFSAAEDPYSVVLRYVSSQWRLASVQLVPVPDNQSATGSVVAADAMAAVTAAQAPALIDTTSSLVGVTTDSSTYSIANATIYAQVFYGPYNSDYNGQYQAVPNDCMNFVSQIITTGGEAQGSVWYPYSATWVNVEDFWRERRQWSSPDGNTEHPQNSDNSLIHAGDLTAWSWGPNVGNPRPLTHEMYVDAKSGNTLMLAAHTNNRWNYPSSTVFSTEPIGTYFLARTTQRSMAASSLTWDTPASTFLRHRRSHGATS